MNEKKEFMYLVGYYKGNEVRTFEELKAIILEEEKDDDVAYFMAKIIWENMRELSMREFMQATPSKLDKSERDLSI